MKIEYKINLVLQIIRITNDNDRNKDKKRYLIIYIIKLDIVNRGKWDIFYATLYTVNCTMYTVNCTIYTVNCTVDNVHYTMCSIQCTSYSVYMFVFVKYISHYSIFSAVFVFNHKKYVHYTLYSVHRTLFTV